MGQTTRNLMFGLLVFAAMLTLADQASAMMNPTTGRFMQRDPIGYPDGMNAYAAYHLQHGRHDPNGTEEQTEDQEERNLGGWTLTNAAEFLEENEHLVLCYDAARKSAGAAEAQLVGAEVITQSRARVTCKAGVTTEQVRSVTPGFLWHNYRAYPPPLLSSQEVTPASDTTEDKRLRAGRWHWSPFVKIEAQVSCFVVCKCSASAIKNIEIPTGDGGTFTLTFDEKIKVATVDQYIFRSARGGEARNLYGQLGYQYNHDPPLPATKAIEWKTPMHVPAITPTPPDVSEEP